MAVTRTGSWGYIESTANSGSQAVTVPADAELMVVCVAEYSDGGNYFSGGSLALNSVGLTASADYDAGSDNWAGVIFTLKDPATGSQTLAWDWSGSAAPYVGLRIYYAFFKGVAAANWIKASGGSNAKSTAQKTTGSMSAASGDMVVALGSSYEAGTYTFTWGNATSVLNATYASVHYNIAEGTPSAAVTVTSNCSQEYNMMAAIVIAAAEEEPSSIAADGGSYSITGQDAGLDWSGAPTDNCDMYFDWRAGSDGNVMTNALAEGGCWPATPPATPFAYPSSPLTILAIETDAGHTYNGTVICGGVEHDLLDITQGMRFGHASTASEIVRCEVPNSTTPVVSVGFFYKTTLHTSLYEQYGQCGIEGISDGDWAILSTYIDGSSVAHACLETNGHLWPATPANAPTLAQDTWYWITVQYNRTTAKAYLRAYLASTMALVGSEIEADLVASPPYAWCVDFGLVASEGNSEAGAYSWYGAAMVDWTDGTFPLLPTSGLVDYTLACDGGAFTLAGTDAGALRGSKVDAEAGSVSITGQDAGAFLGRKIGAEAGSYAVAGQDVTLVYVPGGGAYLLTADGGAYAVTGEAIALLRAAKIDLDGGAYAVAGSDAGALRAARIGLDPGSYTLDGQDATLVYLPGGGAYVLTAEGGVYAVTGADVGLLRASRIIPEAGIYVATGAEAATLLGRLLDAGAGLCAISGEPAALLRNAKIAAVAGAYVVAGRDAALSTGVATSLDMIPRKLNPYAGFRDQYYQ